MRANHVPLSPLSFLNRAAQVFPDGVAVVDDAGREIGYGQLRARAAKLAGALRARGVGAGDRVAVLAPNDLPLLEAHYGVPGAGAVLVALNTRLAPAEYAYILGHAGVKLLVVDHAWTDAVAEIRDQVPGLETVVEISEGEATAVGDAAYEAWLAQAAGEGDLALPDDEDAAITINYTSGTTGRPKGAVYTHRGAYLNAMGQALELALRPTSTYLWTLPMFHCNGWCFTWAVTAVGGCHVCLRRFDPERALALIGEQRVTHLCGAPVVLNELATHPSSKGRRYDHPVTVATGGAPPSPAVIARMADLGIDVVHLYGLTETYGPSLVCESQPGWDGLPLDELAERLSRQGVATVNVEQVRVVDDELEDVAADGATMGEIVVRANTVMHGYLGDDAATAEAFRGGWFHTGDLAVRHPDGYVEVRDRAKDIIISGGENVSSIEVENVIASHPDVYEVAVVGAPDEKWGEVPVAYVTPADGAELTGDEVIAWVRERLAGFKTPKAVHFRELPKTSTGKIRKTVLREIVATPGAAAS